MIKRFLLLPILSAFLSFGALADDLKLPSGEVLKDATISKVDPIGITYMHSDGMMRVPFEDLPPEIRAKYKVSPQAAAAQRAAENAAINASAAQASQLVQQQEHANNEAQINTVLDKAACGVSGRVLQVIPGKGALIKNAKVSVKSVQNVVVGKNPLDGSPRYEKKEVAVPLRYDLVFVWGVEGVVDNSEYSGTIYPAPDYSYTSVQGATRTVRGYATTKGQTRELFRNE